MNSRVVVTGCLLLMAGPLYAQADTSEKAPAAPKSAGDATASAVELAPVKVTATRLGQAMLDTPAAIDVIRHDAISQGRRKVQLDSALNRVPGVYATNSSNFAQNVRISIRGFGARTPFGVRGIHMLVDGIPATVVDGQSQTDAIDPGSIENIEVLRGPFSALYGNATGGVINITTLEPSDGPVDKAEVSAGSHDYNRESMASARQFDHWGYAATLTRLKQNGYRGHSRVERNYFIGKLEHDVGRYGQVKLTTHLLYAPNTQDPGAVTRQAAHQHRSAARDKNLRYDSRKNASQEDVGVVFTNRLTDKQDYKVHAFYSHRDFSQYLPFGSANGGGAVAYARNFFGGGIQTTRYDTLFGHDNELVIGFDAQTQQDDRQRYNNDFGSQGVQRMDQDETATNYAIFLQDVFTVTSSLKATLGMRYDWLSFDIADHFRSDGDQSGNRDYRRTSANFGLNYTWTPGQHVYANIANAFEAPTFTEFANPTGSGGFNPSIEPQKAVNYEIGAKGKLGDRGRYQLDFFWVTMRDGVVAYDENGTRTFYENSGRDRRKGLESKISFNITPTLSTTLSYTLASYEYRNFVDQNGHDYSGNRLPGIPEQKAFGELKWQRDDIGYAAVDLLWVGSIYADDANKTRVSSHAVVKTRFGKTFDIGSKDLTAYAGIDNLLDKKYYDNIRINSYGGRYFEPAPGRTLYAGLKVRF